MSNKKKAKSLALSGLNAVKKTPTGATGGKLQSAAKTGVRQKTAADLYAETVAGAKKFASISAENKDALAAALAGNAITNPGNNGLNYWSDAAGRQSVIDSVRMKKALANLFNDEKYALNPQTTFLPELPYLQQLQEQKQMELAKSKVQDDFMRASKEQNADQEIQWQNLYKAVQEEQDTGDVWYNLLLADHLLNNPDQLWDFEAADARYSEDVMDDVTYNAEVARLQKQLDSVDWETKTGSKTNRYQSQTALLQDQLALLGKTITDKSAAAELEALARSNPNYDALTKYTGPTLKMGENDDYMFSSPWFYINNAGAEDFNRAAYKTRVNYATQQVENYQSPYLDLGYAFMDPEEVGYLNVLHAMDMENGTNHVAAYLEAKGSDLAQRRALENENFWSTLASETGTGWLAYLMARSAGVMNYEDKLLQTVAALTGQNDPNAAYYDEENMKQAVDSEIHGNLGDVEWLNKFKIGDQNIGQHIFNTGTGLLDSVIPLGIDALYSGGGLINKALMAGQAYSGALQEAGERDLSPMQTILSGAGDAAWGALVESIGVDPGVLTGKNNFLTNFFSEGAEGFLDNLGSDVKDGVLSALFGSTSNYEDEVSALRLAGVENPEETAFLNRFGEYAQSFIYEGLGGGLMGIPGNIAESVSNRKTGKAIQQRGDAEAMLEIGKSMPKDSEAYAIAVDIEGTVGKGKKMPLGKLGKLTNAIGKNLSEEYKGTVNKVMEDAITERLVELGTDSSKARKNAPVIRKITQGEKLTVAERAAVAWDDNADQVTKEISREMNAVSQGDAQRTGQKWVTDMRIRQVEGTGEYADLGKRYRQAMERPVTKAAKEAAKAGEAKVNRGKTGKPAGKPTAKKVYFDDGTSKGEGDILRFEKDKDGLKMVVQTGKTDKETATVSLDAMTSADGAGTAGIISYLEDTGKHTHDISAEEANTMLAAYNVSGGDVGRFIDDYTTAYLEGYSGLKGSESGMGKEIVNVARTNGQREAEQDETRRKQRASAYKAVANPVAAWLGTVDSNAQVKGQGDVEGLGEALEGLTESQRITAEAAIEFGKAVGLNVVLYESSPERIEYIANGVFDEPTHTVYLDVNSGAATGQDVEAQRKSGTLGYAMGRTLSHELTHYLETAAGEAYAKYSQAVKDALKAKGQDFAMLMREKMDKAIQDGRKLTMQGAAAEVIADASEYMLQDSKFTNNLDTAVKGKIKAFIQNFAQKVKDIFRNLTGGHKESAALREMKDGVYHYMEGLQDLWDAGFVEILDKGTADLSAGDTEMVEGQPAVEEVPESFNGTLEEYQQYMTDIVEDSKNLNSKETTERLQAYQEAEKQFSMRDVDVSYDALVNKEDMHLTMLTDNIGTRDRVAIINAGYENVKSRGTEGKSGMPAIYVKDIERNVHVSKNSLKHGLDRRADAMSTSVQHAGELLENAILINTAAPKKAEATDSYILLSAGKESDGTIIMVEFIVNSFTDEVESFDVMYSMKTKWNQPRQNAELGGEPLRSPDSTISIADLLDYGKDYFSDVLSDDVMKHFGHERKETEITDYLRYSTRDMPEGITIRDYLRDLKPTSRMNETEKYLLKKYQEQLKVLEEKEQLVAQQEEIIRTAPFRNPDGSLNDEITKAKNRYKIYRDQANRAARALTAYERDDGFASILATGRQVVNELQMGSAGGIADAADVLEKDVAELTAKLTKLEADVTRTATGQRNAYARGLYKPDDLKAAAQQLKDTYGSRMSVNNIADRLALTFGELYANDGAEGAKMFSAAAKDLAIDLLRGNKFRYKSEILPLLREKIGSISLSETDVQEIENRGYTLREFRSMLSPYIKVTEGASDLSSYATNAQYYGEGALAAVLNDDTEGNLAMRLYEVISQEKAKEAEIAYEGMTENQLIGMAMAAIAGANLPMSTNNQTVEYLRKELMKYAGENATVAIAVEEAIGKAKTTTAKAGNVWREAVKHTETARAAVEYYRKLEEQRRVLELAEQKKSLTEQLRSDNAQKLKEKVDKQKAEYREKEQKAREYRKSRAELDKVRKRISRNVKTINALRMRETDKKHVPQQLQLAADLLMQTFTDTNLGRLAFPQEKLDRLSRTYHLLLNEEVDATHYWDDEIEADIENLRALSEAYAGLKNKKDGAPSVFSLEGVEYETEILRGVDNVVANILNMIDAWNDNFLRNRTETFETFANKTGEKLLAHADRKTWKGVAGKVQEMLDETLVKGNTTPVYFFEHLDNPEIMDVFNEIREGQNYYAQIVAEGKAFVQAAKKRHNYGKWVADGKLTMKTGQGHTIELTREEAAEIYAIAKREKANKLYQTEHLLYGGFQYKHRDQHVSEDKKTLVKDMPHQLDMADISKISNWLTAEQKAYADELVGFLSTTMADYGNEASMDMYGYKKFTESYYIPFHTVANQRFQKGDEGPQGENAGTGRVKNSGFTHKVQHGANATLYVGGLTETVADHIHKMAAYSAMVQPIENMKRLLNHKVLESDGTVNTIRALIGQKYGKASEDYMTQLLKDLNGATQSDQRAAALTDKLVGAFKRGAVMASASVVLQQPTAMARAMAMISPKYFAQNPFYRPGKGTWEEMLKYSGTAVIKDMGKFDVGMGLTASQYILDENLSVMEAYQRLKGESKTKAGKAAYDRFMAWLTAAPGVADQWTWGLIWKATEAEQADLHPEMDRNSEEFLRLVGQRFDDVVDHTQVYDSVMSRSNLMRSTNALHKMATSFMSEPTLSLNMLYDALTGIKSKRHTGWHRGRIIGSVVASQVLAGALAALVQAWNDDDDERNALEKYADRATGNVLDNLNPLGMIPYISDIVSLFEGYDVERPDMSVIADVYSYGKTFFKSFEDGGQPTWKQIENFAGTLANLTGVPAKNISREIRRTWNAVFNTDWSAPSAFSVGQAMKENLIWYSDKKAEYYQRIVTAEMRGDTKQAEELRTYMLASKGTDEDDLTEGIRDAYKERYEAGGIEKDDAITFLMEHNLVTGETKDERKKSAFQYVDKWEEGTTNYSAYNTLKDAYKSISFSEIQKAWKELTNYGYTDEQVKTQSRTLLKELVQEGTLTTGQATQLLRKWCPYKKDSDNVSKPQEWLKDKK